MNPETVCMLRTLVFEWHSYAQGRDIDDPHQAGEAAAYNDAARDLDSLLNAAVETDPPTPEWANRLVQVVDRAHRVYNDVVHVYRWARFAMVLV